MTRRKLLKKKLEIVFDAKKRKEFLTGFRKRKNERRQRAKEELERNLKEERKRIRQEIKEGFTHMKKTFEPLKELTNADMNEDEYEDDDVKVKIVELSRGELAAQRNMLGENSVQASDDSDVDQNSDDDEFDITKNANCIPGMDFDINAKRKRKSSKGTNVGKDENETEGSPSKKKSKNLTEDFKSKKELDHIKKRKTLKKLKKSKVFKMKERLDKKLNQKKARRDKNNTLRSLPKHLKKKKKFEKSIYCKGRKISMKH